MNLEWSEMHRKYIFSSSIFDKKNTSPPCSQGLWGHSQTIKPNLYTNGGEEGIRIPSLYEIPVSSGLAPKAKNPESSPEMADFGNFLKLESQPKSETTSVY